MEFKYYALNKPFQVLSQFTSEGEHITLGDLNLDLPKDVYSIGRLDYDSEGLLLMTNNNRIKTKLLDPKSGIKKTYFAQLDGDINEEAINKLINGVEININGKTHKTAKAEVEKVSDPQFWERNPPIRIRKNIPTSWIKISIFEGKNRQIRKMTASVGFPTLRLVRTEFAGVYLGELKPGELKIIDIKQIKDLL